MVVQSVLFNKKKYNKQQSMLWLIHNNFNAHYHNPKESPRQTLNLWRWRQEDPKRFKQNSFRTVDGKNGIKFIVGRFRT